MSNFLQLRELRIKNYKSIIDETITLDGYGLYIFTGKNGTGKSNVINAFNSITKNLREEDLKQVSYKNYVNKNDLENKDIEVDYLFDISIELKEELKKAKRISPDLLENMELKKFSFTRFLDKSWTEEKYKLLNSLSFDGISRELEKTYKNYHINEDFLKSGVYYNSLRTANSYNYNLDKVIKEKSSSDINHLKNYIFKVMRYHSPNSFIWIYNECESLFFKDSNLNEYINTGDHIYLKGLLKKLNPKLDLKQCLRDDNGKRRLIRDLNSIINDYINKTWNKSKLSVESKITDDNILKFDILDGDILLDKKTEISSGYKFILSFLTSIFISDSENIEENNIIVIDEPELHLHPSAIREMRKLLLELSKNNYIIISTHSPYMIDYDDLESNTHYYLVDKSDTRGTFITKLEDKSFSDNELFESAFGISFMSDLLASKILIVEGETDVKLLKKYFENKGIQVLGGDGKKVNKWIDFILGKVNCNSKVIALFDADGAGKDYLKKNKEKLDCYILTDIDDSLLKNVELEDLYDIDYLKEEFANIDSSYQYNENKTVWENLKLSGHYNLKKDLKDKWNQYFLVKKNDKTKKIENFVKSLELKFK